MKKSIFLHTLLLFLPVQSFAARFPDCVRFFHFNLAEKKENEIPLYACQKIEKNTAKECQLVTHVNVERFKKSADDVWKQVAPYYGGLKAAGICWSGILSAPGIIKSPALSLLARLGISVDQWIANDGADEAAYRRNKEGKRKPGDVASREDGEIVDSVATNVCRKMRETFVQNPKFEDPAMRRAAELGWDVATHYFMSAHMQRSVYRGDRRAISEMYANDPARMQEEFRQLDKKTEEIMRAQKAVYEKSKDGARVVYDFLTAVTPSEVPVGVVRTGLSNNLQCLGEKPISIVRGMICAVARGTAQFETYDTGKELFENGPPVGPLVPTGTLPKIAEAIYENCSPKDAPVKRNPGEVNSSPVAPYYPLP